jgi:DNA replication initiation complex subunit (GINS family)
MLRRKKKILELAFVATETGISKRDFENMLQVEKEMFDSIMKTIEKSDKKVSEMLKGMDEEDLTKAKNKMIVFIEDTDEYMYMQPTIASDGDEAVAVWICNNDKNSIKITFIFSTTTV